MKKSKNKLHPLASNELNILNEPYVAYGAILNSMDYRISGLLNAGFSAKTAGQDLDLISLIRVGISKKSLDHLIAQIGYSISDIASVLHVSDRNLRRYEPQEKLNAEQSERLVEMAKLYAKGEDVFGSIDTFNEWMNSEILALGNQTPKSFLDTSLGIQLLMKELSRIEHGVFA
jgi:putative toxin-antitoxin system antitoxin component (TIGR02293 family)